MVEEKPKKSINEKPSNSIKQGGKPKDETRSLSPKVYAEEEL